MSTIFFCIIRIHISGVTKRVTKFLTLSKSSHCDSVKKFVTHFVTPEIWILNPGKFITQIQIWFPVHSALNPRTLNPATTVLIFSFPATKLRVSIVLVKGNISGYRIFSLQWEI